MKKIDCSDLQSNESTEKIENYFNTIGEGDAIVFVEDEFAKDNIIKYASGQGYHVRSRELGNGFEIIIEKRGCLEILDEKEFVVLIATDKLGDGNDKLGENLMVSYFAALSADENLPTKIVFLNGGVKLVCENLKIIQSVSLLRDMGVEIYVSKMCLKSYKLEDKLAVGVVADMNLIVEIMNTADEVIKL